MLDVSIETLLWITAFATTATAVASIGIYFVVRRIDDGPRDWEAFMGAAGLRDAADPIPELSEKATLNESLRFIACAQRSLLACQLQAMEASNEPPPEDEYRPMTE